MSKKSLSSFAFSHLYFVLGAGWSFWTTGACSATCGRGTRQKTRTCVNGNIGSAGCPSGGETESEVK